ncbi:N-acetylneuraminate synthase family protein [Hwanghaeella sp.]|uniref:N-acetylneuraminate synthase family protein n=1 Tax=Hwanghaeella sp. TaxID=2605943 RepID=UPI003CCB8DAF
MSRFKGFPVDRTFIVAEVGNNHEGSADVAAELVQEAAKAGVDAVKFQTFRTEEFVSPRQEERFARMKRFELSQDDFSGLADLARSNGLIFMSTPLDHTSARFLGGIVDIMKVASGDITHLPLIREIAKHGLPMIISTGNADLPEIDRALEAARNSRSPDAPDAEIALLHCVSAYPAPAEQANLAAMATLRKRYDCPVGYSDHTSGSSVAVLAVAAGARIVEKHFTLDNNYSDFRDHQLSADPSAMAALVSEIRRTEAIMGSGEKQPQACEASSRLEIRRSIAIGKPISAGAVLTEEHLVWLRPGDGLAPGDEGKILGKKATHDMAPGTFPSLSDFT